MDLDPLIYDRKSRSYRIAIFMHMIWERTFLELCCPPAADSSFGFCGDYGHRSQLHRLYAV